jgi:Tfp pilus assembly protein PilX
MSNANRTRRSERGVALIIAIFTMMLISVVATALILMAGTASAIKANYKNSMQSFYDAKAGLEEGRSRLWLQNPNCIIRGNPNCTNHPPNTCLSLPMPTNHVCYITNPNTAAGEANFDPTQPTSPYPDTEYSTEYSGGAQAHEILSNSPGSNPNIPGPLYKWVRITPATEQSIGMDVDNDNSVDAVQLYFDGSNTTTSSAPTNSQVLEVTALAVTPGGGFSGRRLLQYLVTENPNPIGELLASGTPPTAPAWNQILPAALTLDGNGVSYTGGPGITISGNDAGGGPGNGVAAIGYTNSSDGTSVRNAAQPPPSYQSPPPTQSVQNVSLPLLMQSPIGLNSLVNAITQDATVVITPGAGNTANQSSLPSTMSATNPVTVVVNGNFSLSHTGPAFTGYGLLLVTGNFQYDPDDSWNGIILVIGTGVFNGSQHGNGGQINGAVLVANIKDSNGNLLSALGPASVNLSGGGNGIQYNSSMFSGIQSMVPYQVLSFREIALTQ